MATPSPTTLSGAWVKIGDTGYEYLVSLNAGQGAYAFGTTLPGSGVMGHPLDRSQVITPPGSDNVYARATGLECVITVTQGNAA